MEFYNELIQRLTNIINLLNEVEVKNFNNIKNLGAAIQQTDNVIKIVYDTVQKAAAKENVKENLDESV